MTRVLIVDDDPDIRNVISYALRDEGYEVDEAPDGAVALELVSRQHPDIILLDMRMPGVDGWEFVTRYRELYEQQASIIVLTAAKDAAKRASDINVDSYVSKPFDLDVLVERVSAIARKVGPD